MSQSPSAQPTETPPCVSLSMRAITILVGLCCVILLFCVTFLVSFLWVKRQHLEVKRVYPAVAEVMVISKLAASAPINSCEIASVDDIEQSPSGTHITTTRASGKKDFNEAIAIPLAAHVRNHVPALESTEGEIVGVA